MKIFYTGVGSNRTGEHTIQEFLNIMYLYFTTRQWSPMELKYYYTVPELKFKRFKLPEEFPIFTLQDWIDYSGASILYNVNEYPDDICNECGKVLIIKDGECVNCEYIRYINLHCNEIFGPLEEYEEYSDSC